MSRLVHGGIYGALPPLKARFFRALVVLAALSVLLAFVGAGSTSAHSGSVTYDHHIGDSFLASVNPEFSPDVAMAANGDTITLTGSGTLGVHPKSVSGGGDFIHKDAGGSVLATGTWTAQRLLAFKEFPKGEGFPEDFAAGHAVMMVQLSVGGTPVHTGILYFDCDLEENPPGHGEGSRLAVQGALNFNQKVSGATLFVRHSD